MPRPLVELLRAHHAEFPSPELVFTNTGAGPVGRTSFRSRIWKPAVRRASLPERLRFRFHDLRHSFATSYQLSLGLPVKDVQRLMGHERASTTLELYTHQSGQTDERVRQAFADDPLTTEPVEDPEDEEGPSEDGR